MSMPPTSISLSVGETIDDCEILGVLGRGGMGEVFRCRHPKLGIVAVKTLHASLAQQEAFAERFAREAQASARIGSARIARVYDAGVHAGSVPYIVMEHLEGETLSARLTRCRTLQPDEIFFIVTQLLEGLAAAHDAGIVHRDLKPANVFIVRRSDGSEEVKLLDFGISKFEGQAALTAAGLLLGTPQYMAPETVRGAKNAEARSDLYSVGVIMFRAISGETPYQGSAFHELVMRLLTEEARDLADLVPNIDPELVRIVRKALRRTCHARFKDAREFAYALRVWNDGRAPSIPRKKHAQHVSSLPPPPVVVDQTVVLEDEQLTVDWSPPQKSRHRVLLAALPMVLIAVAMATLLLQKPRAAVARSFDVEVVPTQQEQRYFDASERHTYVAEDE
jgi:serine/threonine protein kinase